MYPRARNDELPQIVRVLFPAFGAPPLGMILTGSNWAFARRRPRLLDRLGAHRTATYFVDPTDLAFAFTIVSDGENALVGVVGKATTATAGVVIRAPNSHAARSARQRRPVLPSQHFRKRPDRLERSPAARRPGSRPSLRRCMMASARMELVCPAETPATLRAAVTAGADAVYCGFNNETNARNFPGLNFSPQERAESVRFAHGHGKKVLVAFNTFAQPGRVDLWRRAADDEAECGADAVIAADLAVLDHVATNHGGLRLHLSVRAAAATPEAISLYAGRFGVPRVVLSASPGGAGNRHSHPRHHSVNGCARVRWPLRHSGEALLSFLLHDWKVAQSQRRLFSVETSATRKIPAAPRRGFHRGSAAFLGGSRLFRQSSTRTLDLALWGTQSGRVTFRL